MTRKTKPFNHSAKVLRRSDLTRGTRRRTPSPIHASIRAAIRQIPRGRVSTYGAVARAAGFPGSARQVARTLHSSVGLPWQRVLGSGGEIKLRGDSAMEQRFRLEAEGVRFRGKRVDMKAYEFRFEKSRSK
jgi:methylated-DNA-protein-cysteine methyltransferase related protein